MSPDRFRWVVSTVLLGGLAVSTALLLAGLVASWLVGWQGLVLGMPATALARIGLIVLIATPVLRVLVSVIGFILERDRLYALITAAVLGIVLASLLLVR
ncbi:MAG: hypothetical protein DLM71_05245 [Chloroflexi bacterium]|nr:MAG: hypothetical protein DLM71_05245 [Chloroflexota bacterium]